MVRSFGIAAEEANVGLSVELIQRMRVQRVDKFGQKGEWREFGCCILVESFVFKRMDGSLVLKYEFRHPHQIKCKWRCV